MLYSMTGFGRGESTSNAGDRLVTEIASVNRKQLELRFNLPRELAAAEPELRKLVTAKITRGSVNVRIGYYPGDNAAKNYVVNEALLQSLISACVHAKEVTHAEAEISISELLTVPGVVTSPELPTDDPELHKTLLDSLEKALVNFNAMRRTEGEHLKNDFEERISFLQTLLGQILPLAAQVNADLKTKLLSKLAEANLAVDVNDERFLKEVLFYADKADVTEEITRLQSHFKQFSKFLFGAAAEAGRSLDFLMQEMFREITTLGNKAGTGEISPLVVRFKSELEKLREQIQNIE